MAADNVPEGMAKLAKRIDENDGVLTTTMQDVRDAYGSERLGVNVRQGIQDMLDQLGVGHYPNELPGNQAECIRLYRRSSPVGKLIRAALTPGQTKDELLRRAAANEAETILQKVRELVCE